MKVLVLGATGFIGPAVLRRLAALGHEPLGVSRGGSADLTADVSDASGVARLLAEARTGAVVDLRALTLDATRPLLRALDGARRYVLASSGDVYRQYGALQRKEAVEARLLRLDEEAPLRHRLYPYREDPPRPLDDPAAWKDAYDKVPIENAVRETLGERGVIVRLPMVYGPNDRQRRFAWAIRPMAAGAAQLDIDSEWAAWRTSYGFVEDVAEGLALAAVHPNAAGRTYNLGPTEAPDHAEWARRIARSLGWTGEISEVGRDAAHDPRRRRLDVLDLAWPLVLESSRIRRELGYAEVADADEALRRTIEDELSRP